MFVTLVNTPITLDPFLLAISQGWTISEGIAYHSGCYPGIIVLKNIEVSEDTTYIINYEIKSRVSGGVYPIIGGVNGTNRTAIGNYTDTIVVPDGATDLTVKFYSDGELSVSYMNAYPVLDNPINGHTLAFNSDNNKWTTEYHWKPEMMLKFVNDLFSWENGRLWQHNVNETRNLFYGQQSYSEIQIIFNINPYEVKNLYSIRVNSNLAWSVTDVYIRPIVGKQSGQRSRIKSGNFVKINGQWFADFLRNQLDPLFGIELEALFKGSQLQGTTASITLRSEDTTDVRLVSVDILSDPQAYTY